MIHCPVCFKLLSDDARGCSRCGWEPPHRAAPGEFVRASVQLEEREAGAADDTGMGVLVRWIKGVLIVLLVLALAGALGRFLVVQNRAAQASWTVQSQLMGWKEDRRSALQEALRELEALHAELLDVENWKQDPAKVQSWRQRWRQRLNRVKAAYQLTGQARFGDLNVRTEEALHNLVLYLSSLERDLQERTPSQTDALEQSIRRAFRDARRSLR